MRTEIARRIVSYLEAAPTPTVSLSRLYGALVAEVGEDAGSYAELRGELSRRSDLFLILGPRHPFGDFGRVAEVGGVAYEAALAEAGFEGGVRIALAEAPTPPSRPFGLDDPLPRSLAGDAADGGRAPLDQVDASLVELWRVTPDDPVLRADLAEAVTWTDELRRVLYRRS